MNCSECGGALIQVDHELTCTECGLVESSFQQSPYTKKDVRFIKEDPLLANSIYLGSILDRLLDKDLHRTMVGKREGMGPDAWGRTLSAETKFKMRRLRYAQKIFYSPDKILNHKARVSINLIGKALGLKDLHVVEAIKYFDKIHHAEPNNDKYTYRVWLGAVCIYAIIKEYNLPIKIVDLANEAYVRGHRISVKNIIGVHLNLSSYFKKQPIQNRTQNLVIKLIGDLNSIPKYRDNPKFLVETERLSLQYLKKMNSKFCGYRPSAIAATAVYVASKSVLKRMNVPKIKQREIAEFGNVTEVTLRNLSKKCEKILIL